MRELAFATTWDTVHPPALELARRSPARPGDLDHLLHLGRVGGGRVGAQAGARISRLAASRGVRR